MRLGGRYTGIGRLFIKERGRYRVSVCPLALSTCQAPLTVARVVRALEGVFVSFYMFHIIHYLLYMYIV